MDKITNLNNSIKSLQTAGFYVVNGWGIISFKSDIEYVASRNSISFIEDLDSSVATELTRELNEVIKPVLVKYENLAKEKLKEAVSKL